jgi:hypothetical protein
LRRNGIRELGSSSGNVLPPREERKGSFTGEGINPETIIQKNAGLWVLFGEEEVYDRNAGKAKKEPYIPGLKTPRFYG